MKFLVVGSGAGGATVARELALSGYSVTIIEKGPWVMPSKAYQCYDKQEVEVDLLKSTCVGGCTLVTAGNAVRTSEESLKKYNIHLKKEFEEVEKELKVSALPTSHLGRGTSRIIEASHQLGLVMESMPKFINAKKCEPCGKCVLGCPREAKWSSLKYLEESLNLGAKIITNTAAEKIIIKDNKVQGLKTTAGVFDADIIILAAGAIETPRLLLKSGISAGHKLFMDTFVTIGGILKGIEFNKEVNMNALASFPNFILAPHFSSLLIDELKSYSVKEEDIIGIMVKIADESRGKVTLDRVYKDITSQDVKLISRGSAIAGAILVEAGVDPKTLVSTNARGAHPGGSAAIGEVVDNQLQTKVEGLYIADASVLPEAPGAPPLLTILALAKRLAKHLSRLDF